MNFERDQAVDAVVLMFWMSPRGIGKPAILQLSWPHCNDATRVSMSPQQIERAESKCSIEQELEVIQEQEPLADKFICELCQQISRLQVSSHARHREQPTPERSTNAQDARLPALGQLSEQIAFP